MRFAESKGRRATARAARREGDWQDNVERAVAEREGDAGGDTAYRERCRRRWAACTWAGLLGSGVLRRELGDGDLRSCAARCEVALERRRARQPQTPCAGRSK